MKKIILLILVSIFILACNEQESSNNISVSGNISNVAEGSKLYIDYLTPTEIITKDTTTTDSKGNYHFDYQIENLGYYRLRINNQNFINLVLNVGETPTINGDGNNLMDTYSIEGSSESAKLKEFNAVIKANYLFQDSLNNVFKANKNDPQMFVQIHQKSLASENNLISYYIQLINENPSSLVSLAAVEQLDPEIHFDYYEKIDASLGKTLSETPYYKTFHKRIELLKKLNTGGEAPEIILNDKDGNPISLSSLRGNIVLIDFWASWCKPCRGENPNVVKAYKKYHQEGFEVFSVSLDGMPQQQNAKQDWIDAIEKDGLIWKSHISDLSGWNSSVVPLYGIQSIPFTVLIDREGNIIGKNVRGVALEQQLAQIFE